MLKDRSNDAKWLREKFLEATNDLDTAEARIAELEAVLNQAYAEQSVHGFNSLETFELMGKALKRGGE